MEFDEVYRQYFQDIYHYVLGLSGDGHLAEELTQEAFFKALRSLESFDGRKDIRAWLFTIAKNTYRSYLKKNRRQQWRYPEKGSQGVRERDTAKELWEGAQEALVREGALHGGLTQDVDFVEKLMDEEDCIRIHRFLHQMAEPYKEVFNLRVFGELSFEKIGMIFSKSAGWARVTYYRAKKQILEYMEGMEDEKNQL